MCGLWSLNPKLHISTLLKSSDHSLHCIVNLPLTLSLELENCSRHNEEMTALRHIVLHAKYLI
jgi:hypothetical protein